MTYAIIRSDGTLRELEGVPTLEELQSAVGGYFETRNIGPVTMWMNEEGLLLSLPVNLMASGLAGLTIRGDVVLTGGPDGEGETKSLPQSFIHNLVLRGAIFSEDG